MDLPEDIETGLQLDAIRPFSCGCLPSPTATRCSYANETGVAQHDCFFSYGGDMLIL